MPRCFVFVHATFVILFLQKHFLKRIRMSQSRDCADFLHAATAQTTMGCGAPLKIHAFIWVSWNTLNKQRNEGVHM
jgi:hypothetical protein